MSTETPKGQLVERRVFGLRFRYWRCRTHRKVFLWWGRWWAMQIVLVNEWSFGLRIEPKRPLLDFFLGPVTVAFGDHPVLTDPRRIHRHGCQGFIVADAGAEHAAREYGGPLPPEVLARILSDRVSAVPDIDEARSF